MAQRYGGSWTLIKLDVLDNYLHFYTTALKNTNLKICYIDAFAGSGSVDIRGGQTVQGSSIRALSYPFDKYFFFEKNANYAASLQAMVSDKYPNKNVIIKNGDCNDFLRVINSYDWKGNGWRGIIFLDPYALELKWDSLQFIANTHAFDVWYLFPLMGMNRLLRRDGNISPRHRQILNELLGTDDWESEIYAESLQISIFGSECLEKCAIESVKDFSIKRLQSIFPGVSKNALVLRNEQKNTPLFLLCFAVSNPSKKVISLSLSVAGHILSHAGEAKNNGIENKDRMD